jgi:hypothetical protein
LGFLLKDQCPACHGLAMADIAHAQLHQSTSAKLAVDRQVEQSKIPTSTRNLQTHADRPNFLELERRLLPDELSFVPGFPI